MDSLRTVKKRLRGSVEHLPDVAASDTDALVEGIRASVTVTKAARKYVRGFSAGLLPAVGARERIRQYLELNVGTTVTTEEVAAVSGIQEASRRIRELRVEYGYRISTSNTDPKMSTGQYRLESTKADPAAAARWRLANSIRRSGGSVKQKILTYMQASVGQVVQGEELAYLAGARSGWPRRTRELRSEDGWRLVTKMSGRPELGVGEYVLENLDQAPPHDRHIPSTVYEDVLSRDGSACRKCGWRTSDRRPESRRQLIELHHLEHHSAGGANTTDNLVALCNVHHDEAHHLKPTGPGFLDWLNAKVARH